MYIVADGDEAPSHVVVAQAAVRVKSSILLLLLLWS